LAHPMSTTSPRIQDLARRLLALEAARGKSSDERTHAIIVVCEHLRVIISKLVGIAGFAALLSRALAVAKAEVPSLGVLKVRSDGSLEGFEEALQNQDPEPLRSGGVVLVAQLLGLLITFIGQSLTLRVVRDAWTDASWDGIDLSTEEMP
jgi:hypothetical protein